MIFFLMKKKMIVLCSTQQIQITRDLPYHKNKKMDFKKYLKKKPKLNFIAVIYQIQLPKQIMTIQAHLKKNPIYCLQKCPLICCFLVRRVRVTRARLCQGVRLMRARLCKGVHALMEFQFHEKMNIRRAQALAGASLVITNFSSSSSDFTTSFQEPPLFTRFNTIEHY